MIAGDGPRRATAGDAERVEQTRKIIQQIDWDCNLQARFANENIGCRNHMARAIDWGFDEHERLIILEDDCVPSDSFFSYCEEMLERYSDEPRVMTIGGINHVQSPLSADYRFSKYPLIWGWASWRRAWRHYDLEMKAWQSLEHRNRVLDQFTEGSDEWNYWNWIFTEQAAGRIDTWDYSWTFASWLNSGLTILPRENLVSNTGFGENATHTMDAASPMGNLQPHEMKLNHHPDRIERDTEWDRRAREFYFAGAAPPPVIPLPQRKRSRLAKWFGRRAA